MLNLDLFCVDLVKKKKKDWKTLFILFEICAFLGFLLFVVLNHFYHFVL